MRDMDYYRVMKRAEEYVVENKFPPTIADIAAYAPPKNETLKQMKQWRKEAEQVPTEVKLRFREKMKQLIEEKSKRSEEHTSELQSRGHLVCRLLLEKENRHI